MQSLAKINLREYQKECIKVVNELPDGSRTIVCFATGLGKTVTAANFDTKGRMLWISHRDELVRQPERYFTMLGKSYGIEKADEESANEDVVSASIQTISRDKRLQKFKPDDFDIIICDEAQHAAAATYRKVLGYFKPRKLIGLTATPKRGDNARLTDVFDDICFTRDLKWGIENGYLSRIRCIRVSAKFDVKNIKTSMGDLTVSSMQTEMLKSDDDIVVAKAYLEHAVPEHKKTLIYCPTIKVCQRVYEAMADILAKDEYAKVRILSDKTPSKEREIILRDYKDTDKINCIINCMILTEGTDLPQTSIIINNRPTANASLYQQIIGRGTRLADGKEYCLIVDVMGKNSASRNICTAPTLFGIDPDELPLNISKKLYDGDLLEITNDIKENKKEKVNSIILHQELIDIFTGECISIIEDNRSKGLKKIAEEYEKKICPSVLKYDFGDLVVKTGADDDRYYCIPVTYHGNIYISKPDMLEKSKITIDIPKEESMDCKEWKGTSNYIPVTAAIETVDMIVRYGILPKYKHRWSKKARGYMQKGKPSANQLDYVKGLYKDNNINNLNKLDASNLIELKKEIDMLKREHKILGYALSAAQKNEQKRKDKEQIRLEQELAERERQKNKEIFHENYKSIIKKCIDIKTAQEKILSEMISEKAVCSVPVMVSKSYGNMFSYHPTAKQNAFLKSLEHTLEEKGFILECHCEDATYNMYTISFVIKLLKELESFSPPPDEYEYFVKIKQFIDKVSSLTPPIATDKSISCEYILRKQQPVFEEI